MNPIDIISKISVQKIVGYISDIVLIFISPRIFFKSFNVKTPEDKLLQIVFYVLFYSSAYLIFDEKESFNSTIKWLIILTLYSSFTVLILIISNLILSTFFKAPKIRIIDIVIYDLIAVIFFELIIDFLETAFEFAQADEFIFIANTIRVYGFFYLLVISQSVFYDRRKHIFLGILMTWIIANIADRSYEKIISEEFADLFIGGMDSAAEEFSSIDVMSKGNISLNPAMIYTSNYGEDIKFFENDTLKNNKKLYFKPAPKQLQKFISETNTYIKSIKRKVDFLNKEKGKLKYRRNREAIDAYLVYYKRVLDFYDRKQKGEEYSSRNIVVGSKGDSVAYVPMKTFVDLDIYRLEIKAKNNAYNLYRRSIIANSPMILEDSYLLKEDFKTLDYVNK